VEEDYSVEVVMVVVAGPLKMCSMRGLVVEEEDEILLSFLFDKSKPDEIE
jgi:hypothetical protein